MGKGGQAYVVVHVQSGSFFIERHGGVFFATECEFLRFGSEVSVQNGVVSPFPCGTDFAVRIFYDNICVCFQNGIKFAVSVYFFAVVEAFIYFQRNDTVVFNGPGHIGGGTALSEVHTSVHADIFVGFFVVCVPYDVHGGEAHGVFTETHDF